MVNVKFWFRWTMRDLRDRWVQVIAVALIIALGTGVYAGLCSTTPWREQSFDESYARLNMYDLRVKLAASSYVESEALLRAVQQVEHAGWVRAVEPRLIVPTLVDVPTESTPILVPGRIIGLRVGEGMPAVNGIFTNEGRGLRSDDAGQYRGVLEYQFAHYYGLPPQGTILVNGDQRLDYVGLGMTPETFMVIAEEVGFKDEANFAVVMVPLETAQSLSGQPGQANDLVIMLNPGADRDLFRAELEQVFAREFAHMSITMMGREEDPAYEILHSDVEIDDQIFRLIAYLFLAGAAFGTFNLASRVVEAQRRQIGIGMALGLPPRVIALRPLLLGLQIALLGVIFGLIIGALVGQAFGSWTQDIMPMPWFAMPFQPAIFLQAALLGVLLPVLATLYPVWRAVRVTPVDAIKTGYLVAKGGGLAPSISKLPLPGRSFIQIPLRNLLRSPRRSLLTLMGVAMAIIVLIANMGILDSFLATIDDGEREFLQHSPRRMTVVLDNFYPIQSQQVAGVQASPVLSTAEPGIRVWAELRHEDIKLDSSLELLDLNSELWTPTIIEGERPSAARPGILISEKAADDLGVSVGDTMTVRYPQRVEPSGFRMMESDIRIAGIHPSPLRYLSYMNIEQADLLSLEGLANIMYVDPVAGVSQNDVQRALFQRPGVASVQSVSSMTRVIRDMMELLIAFMMIVVIAVLALAFLIAFNSTSINVDERSREIATMFAFGLPIRTVTRMTLIENLVIGILGTSVGIGAGWLVLVWMMNERMERILPDVHLTTTVQLLSLVAAVLLGVGVVALTPLLNLRKMTRMNLPSTLRVME